MCGCKQRHSFTQCPDVAQMTKVQAKAACQKRTARGRKTRTKREEGKNNKQNKRGAWVRVCPVPMKKIDIDNEWNQHIREMKETEYDVTSFESVLLIRTKYAAISGIHSSKPAK